MAPVIEEEFAMQEVNPRPEDGSGQDEAPLAGTDVLGDPDSTTGGPK
jgi:hypothetical protein